MALPVSVSRLSAILEIWFATAVVMIVSVDMSAERPRGRAPVTEETPDSRRTPKAGSFLRDGCPGVW